MRQKRARALVDKYFAEVWKVCTPDEITWEIVEHLLETHAESEAALAREQERMECAKAVCDFCREPNEYKPAKKTGRFEWMHERIDESYSDFCNAALIHERRGRG